MLGLVLICAVIFGLVVNASSEYQVTVRAKQLPADDQKFHDWLTDQDGIQNVSVTRDGNTVRGQFSRRGLAWSFAIVDPPWSELGYTRIEGASWSIENRGILGGFSNWFSQLPLVHGS
jgi:hypothetical protein